MASAATPLSQLQLRAVIYVKAGPNAERDKGWCVTCCNTNDWLIVAVVVDSWDDGNSRMEVIRMLYEHTVDVVCVADPQVFSGSGAPRLEVASSPLRTVKPRTGRRRRPRLMR